MVKFHLKPEINNLKMQAMASVSKKNMKTNRIVSNDSMKGRGKVSDKNMIYKYLYPGSSQ